MEISLLFLIASAFVGAFAAPAIARVAGKFTGAILALLPLSMFSVCVQAIRPVMDGAAFREFYTWVPSLNLSLSFYVDGLSLLFLLVISLVGTLVLWYAGAYLAGDRRIGQFFLYLVAFLAAMMGLVCADNLLLLFVFWELTSITSYLLIGYYCEEAESRRSALQALLVTGGGGLAMLGGLILLGNLAGSYEISELLKMDFAGLAAHRHFPIVFSLLLLGAFTKSAQFPFHFWLPNAMAAPAPVSALLHSATMVKAGVFLLARLFPVLSASPFWTPVVATFGAITMLTGVWLGLRQTDLKKIFAYTTVAVLGTLTMLLGLGTSLAVKAAMLYLVAHALYKGALFMVAGSVDHETGTRDINALGGLGRKMRFTALAAMLGALSMAGLPFLLGFVSKEYFYKALLRSPGPPYLWEALGVAASSIMAALAVIAGIRPFLGPYRDTPKHAHEAPAAMWLGPLILGALALQLGFFPGTLGDWMVLPAVRSIIAEPTYVESVKLWHGWTAALGLSALTFILAAVVFVMASRIRSLKLPHPLVTLEPERIYETGLAGLLTLARCVTASLQTGSLSRYVLISGGVLCLCLAYGLLTSGVAINLSNVSPVNAFAAATCVTIVISSVMACVTTSRFSAILALGVVGLGIAILYFLFSAPDLALTQILVETLTIVIFVLAFLKLPEIKEYSRKGTRVRDAVIAAIFGGIMGWLVLSAFYFDRADSQVAEFMRENSLTAAFGRNVVNVILVDFRALDTLGEICVLAVAALGVFSMLARPSKKARNRE